MGAADLGFGRDIGRHISAVKDRRWFCRRQPPPDGRLRPSSPARRGLQGKGGRGEKIFLLPCQLTTSSALRNSPQPFHRTGSFDDSLSPDGILVTTQHGLVSNGSAFACNRPARPSLEDSPAALIDWMTTELVAASSSSSKLARSEISWSAASPSQLQLQLKL